MWKFENAGRGTWVSEVVKGFRNRANLLMLELYFCRSLSLQLCIISCIGGAAVVVVGVV